MIEYSVNAKDQLAACVRANALMRRASYSPIVRLLTHLFLAAYAVVLIGGGFVGAALLRWEIVPYLNQNVGLFTIGFPIVGLMVGISLFSITWPWLNRSLARLMRLPQPSPGGELGIEFDDKGLTLRSDGASSWIGWSLVDAVTLEGDELFVIAQLTGRLVPLPDDGEEARAELLSYIWEHLSEDARALSARLQGDL